MFTSSTTNHADVPLFLLHSTSRTTVNSGSARTNAPCLAYLVGGFLSRCRSVCCWLKSNNNRSTWHLLAAPSVFCLSGRDGRAATVYWQDNRYTWKPSKIFKYPFTECSLARISPLLSITVSPPWPISPASSAHKLSRLVSTPPWLASFHKNKSTASHLFSPLSVCVPHSSYLEYQCNTYPLFGIPKMVKFFT